MHGWRPLAWTLGVAVLASGCGGNVVVDGPGAGKSTGTGGSGAGGSAVGGAGGSANGGSANGGSANGGSAAGGSTGMMQGSGAAPGTSDNCKEGEGYIVDWFEGASSLDGVPFRLVGIYEPGASGHFEMQVDAPGPTYIGVSAYDATTWTIHAGSGAKVLGVYAIGIYDQKVSAPDGAKVVTESSSTGQSACGYSWPYNGEGCDTNDLIAKMKAVAGRPVTSFRGCYDMNQLTFTQ
jgi:hypothetical protein